jgi:ribosome-associated heat shock protein Hsp15
MGQVIDNAIRIDRWLWAARFFKTRTLAAQAVAGGKVKVNGERVKPAKVIRVGDQLVVRKGPYEYEVRVLALAAQRGPAKQAALLCEERGESKTARETLAVQLGAQRNHIPQPKKRPNKQARRAIIRLKQGSG